MGERCLHCYSDVNRIICDGCVQLLDRSNNVCLQCAKRVSAEKVICGQCQNDPPAFDRTYAVCAYDYPVDSWVWSLKFKQNLAYARLMAYCLYKFFPVIDAEVPLVPVPLHNRRYLSRGHNQSLEIAKAFVQFNGNPLVTDMLTRVRDTPMQSGLNKRQRTANMQNAFLAQNTKNFDKVILVDDVMTTGQTLRSCAKAFAAIGVCCQVMVFARA